ncbi:hypothetical protein K435DRAFT_808187 [Dendrothele bispora CBS 962.96]|uniref:Uncharacterized protein n=1 Tax=Dendrothele bispora (strain CBS 962.96) TaxID=1314807 RepID=A0A4V4HCB3_DENBC|nr:hypothetical protein K435DRAFT_808187 [Dendrothele bispora CBS 962.96]
MTPLAFGLIGIPMTQVELDSPGVTGLKNRFYYVFMSINLSTNLVVTGLNAGKIGMMIKQAHMILGKDIKRTYYNVIAIISSNNIFAKFCAISRLGLTIESVQGAVASLTQQEHHDYLHRGMELDGETQRE